MSRLLRFVTLVGLAGASSACSCNADPEPPGTALGDLPTGGVVDPGRVTMHRLNRTEYDNTVQDLLGTQQTPARDFPGDDAVDGFDNIASNLSTSPLHIELYEIAAESLADEVLFLPTAEWVTQRAEGEGPNVSGDNGGPSGAAWVLSSNGDLTTTFTIPEAGRYTLSARAWARQAGPEVARMTLGYDGVDQATFDVVASNSDEAMVHSVEVELRVGDRDVFASFINDYWNPNAGEDRNLYIDWIEVTGPLDVVPEGNPLRDRLIGCDPDDIGVQPCVDEVLTGLADRAYRRPATTDEIARLSSLTAGILDDGGTFDEALKYGVMAVLTSPHFLYRPEISDDPTSDRHHLLSGWEVASRLSYFLWSSMPDETLFEAARSGDLDTVEGIEAQVRRMLVDPHAAALVDHFGGQWLYIRGVDEAFKDPGVYPDFDDALRASMKEEMTRFFDSFVFGNRDLRELLTATEGQIDDRLAAHYGVAAPGGPGFWGSVDLAALDRGGLLGQAGLLTVESYPARTSPVIRGKFVLGQLLCDEPPPPPPGVEGLDEDIDALTLREQLEQHRADPVCRSCHESMDEIGFALEHFDALGAWRDEDRGLPIDASGSLPDGTSFYGAREMASVIAEDPRFPRCVNEQLTTYGLGRVLVEADGPTLDQSTAAFAAGEYRFDALVVAIATSDAFRMQRGEP